MIQCAIVAIYVPGMMLTTAYLVQRHPSTWEPVDHKFNSTMAGVWWPVYWLFQGAMWITKPASEEAR